MALEPVLSLALGGAVGSLHALGAAFKLFCLALEYSAKAAHDQQWVVLLLPLRPKRLVLLEFALFHKPGDFFSRQVELLMRDYKALTIFSAHIFSMDTEKAILIDFKGHFDLFHFPNLTPMPLCQLYQSLT